MGEQHVHVVGQRVKEVLVGTVVGQPHGTFTTASAMQKGQSLGRAGQCPRFVVVVMVGQLRGGWPTAAMTVATRARSLGVMVSGYVSLDWD